MARSDMEVSYQEEEIVIVGAGIAGLATAVALRRIGLRSLVLERHEQLRSAGAALTLAHNAWYALRALGVAHKLTPLYDSFKTVRVTNLATGRTQEFRFSGNADRDDEIGVRSVHRKALLEALAEELPPETIRFASKLVAIKTETAKDSSQITALHLDDGTVIRAKVLIGCDGLHSVVAQWLGLSAPVSSGRSGIRGLAIYPDGHGFDKEVQQYLSEGIRAGFIPLNDTDIYWFLVNNSISSEMFANPELILGHVTDRMAKDFPEEFLDIVRHSDHSNLTWAPLLFRAPWDILMGRANRGSVTVAGDAFHPMTPDLGQGGCSALEDAVVLARALSHASTPLDGVARYVQERRWRAAWLVAGSRLSGWVQQGGTNVQGVCAHMIKWFRDWLFYKFVMPRLAKSTWYNCGDLVVPPTQEKRAPDQF